MQEQGISIRDSGGGGAGEPNHQLKAEIATHPLYEQLLSAHVACLRVATPIDQLPLIDSQLSQSQNLLRSYAHYNISQSLSIHQRQELDNFLTQYFLVLCSFREELQQHVRIHAVEAVMACREIEHNLQTLTGICIISLMISLRSNGTIEFLTEPRSLQISTSPVENFRKGSLHL